MKLSLTIGLVVLLVIGPVMFANRIAEHYIAQEIPEVLSGIEGQPASLTDIRANIWRLQASAEKFTYGRSRDEAIVATRVTVKLDLGRLLRGEIYIRSATADLLQIRPTLWLTAAESKATPVASRKGDEQESYASTIRRWVPDLLELGKLEVFIDDTRVFVGEEQRWTSPGTDQQRILWSDTRGSAAYHYELAGNTMLDVDRKNAGHATLKVSSEEAGLLLTGKLDVELVDDRYLTKIAIESQGLKGIWQFEADELFDLPAESKLEITHLEPAGFGHAATLFDFTVGRDDASKSRDFLKAPLPNWQLPEHRIQTTIKEFELGDDAVRNTNASIQLKPGTAGRSVIAVDNLHAQLPRSDLQGSFSATLGQSWNLALNAQIATHAGQQNRSSEFVGSSWYLQAGSGSLKTEGATLAALLENSSGSVDLQGVYMAAHELPFTLKATVDERRGRVGTDVMELQLGNSQIEGSAWISEDQQNLFLQLDAVILDLTELRAGPAPKSSEKNKTGPAGLGIPEVGWWKSDMKVDATLTSPEVRLPGLKARDVNLEFHRAKEGDRLHLAFAPQGTGRIEANVHKKLEATGQTLALDVTVTDVDLATLGLDTPPGQVTGNLNWQGMGGTYRELIGSLAGPIELKLEPAKADSAIDLQATSSLLIQREQILGLDLNALTLTVPGKQTASGDLSLDATIPKISGRLQMGTFEVDKVMHELPEKDETQVGLTATLDALPEFDLAFKADRLNLQQHALDGFTAKLVATGSELSINDLKFFSRFGDVRGDGKLGRKGEQVDIVLNADLGKVELNRLLRSEQVRNLAGPLSGSVKLQTSGKDWKDLSANLSGHIRLSDPAHGADHDDRLNIEVQLQQVTDGMAADIRSLQWGRSDLRGQLKFSRGEPPTLTADIQSDYLDADYIQKKLAAVPRAARPTDGNKADGLTGSDLGPSGSNRPADAADVGNSALRLVRGVLASPFRLFRGDPETGSKHFFDQEPYRIDVMQALDADVRLLLKQVSGEFGAARQLIAEASLNGGILKLQVSADEINSAPFDLAFEYDSDQSPPQATLTSTLSGFYPAANKAFAPRSGYFDLHAEGVSQAELMATMNGEVFVRGDQGEADIEVLGLGFFTGDLLSRVAGSLVPQAEAVPTLDCAVVYVVITDGVMQTPYGMVLQTPKANILIRTTVDMKKETIAAQFDSRNRTGMGISIGSVFSNTVRLAGPLVEPKILPDATGLAWRSWAALITGGVSLLGESVYKRMLGERDPCKHFAEQIQEKVCRPGTTPAASSPLVCGA